MRGEMRRLRLKATQNLSRGHWYSLTSSLMVSYLNYVPPFSPIPVQEAVLEWGTHWASGVGRGVRGAALRQPGLLPISKKLDPAFSNQGTKGRGRQPLAFLFLGDPTRMYSNVTGGYGVVVGHSQNVRLLPAALIWLCLSSAI